MPRESAVRSLAGAWIRRASATHFSSLRNAVESFAGLGSPRAAGSRTTRLARGPQIARPRSVERGAEEGTAATKGPSAARPSEKARLFGPLPELGIWTGLGLSRAQFCAILGGSIVLFLLVGGPLWRHVRDPHFARIAVSYAVIPLGVLLALLRNGRARFGPIVAASMVIALLKLLITAGLDVVIALARSGGA